MLHFLHGSCNLHMVNMVHKLQTEAKADKADMTWLGDD
jgi:hypothetical protein